MHEITPRLQAASSLFQKQIALSEITTKISQSVDESLSKQQKEFFLRQQLAAIQRELSSLRSPSSNLPSSSATDSSAFGATSTGANGGNELDDDESAESSDLLDIRSKIECMEQGSEERKMGVREWRRLKRIPGGSVENGVIRTYVSRSQHGSVPSFSNADQHEA
jgi:ATP-dependent Lon protease